MSSMYTSKVGESSPDLKGVAGTKATPLWHSPSPIRQLMVDHDIDVFRELYARSEFGKLGHLYLGMPMGGQNMLVSRLQDPGKCFFVLVDSGAPGKFGWPAVRRELGGELYRQLAVAPGVGDTPFLHVYSLDDWTAVEVDFEAPLARVARHKGCDLVGAWARQVSKSEPLLKYAALRCFFSLPKTALLTPARHLDCECDAGGSLLERWKKLIYHSSGQLPPNNTAEILMMRFDYMKDDGMPDLFDLDGIEAVLEAAEKNDLEPLKKARQVSRAEHDEFHKQLRDYRTASVSRGAQSAKRATSREAFTALLPPGVIGRDESFHGRWRIYWKDPPKRRSASWDLYGYEGAMRMLLKETWTEICQLHGVDCPIPGIL